MREQITGRREMENRYRKQAEKIIEHYPVLEGFFASLNLESTSIYEYLRHVSKFLGYTGKPVEEIGYEDYIRFLNKNKRADEGGSITSSYQIVIYSALKKFSRYCYLSEKTGKDYMKDIERPKSVQSQRTIIKRKENVMTEEELKEYIKNIKEEVVYGAQRHISDNLKLRNWCIIQILLTTGIRCSALRNMNIDDVDFVNKKIRITEKGNTFREITLADSTVEDLIQWVSVRETLLEGADEPALFISIRKKRISPTCTSNLVERYGRGINGKHISPHKLRATFATMLYEKTNDIMSVKETLGHASIKTSQLYIRQNKDMSRVASGIMSDIIHSGQELGEG